MVDERVKTSNISIRLPDEYRKRLQLQADKRGVSFNAHLVRILEIHLMHSGFGPASLTSTVTDRLFEIRSELAHDNVDETVWAFFADEPKFEKERAYYLLGLGRTVIRDWKVKDKVTAAKEIGLALLTYYNKKGFEIDRLRWTQFPDDGRRVLQASEVPDTMEEFLAKLMDQSWTDEFVEPTEKSQDLRRGRSESALYR
jgi:hypothetical protein